MQRESRRGAGVRVVTAEEAAKLLNAKGRQLEASVMVLPEKLPPGERTLASNALCEAAGILKDAAVRVLNPLPPVD